MKLALPLLLLFAMLTPSGADGGDPLARYRWKNRVIVLGAPNSTDAALQEQKALLAGDPVGLSDRDLVVVEILGADRDQARKDLKLGNEFSAALVGKDGGVKLRSDKPISLKQLYQLIDSMPMRQSEMRRAE